METSAGSSACSCNEYVKWLNMTKNLEVHSLCLNLVHVQFVWFSGKQGKIHKGSWSRFLLISTCLLYNNGISLFEFHYTLLTHFNNNQIIAFKETIFHIISNSWIWISFIWNQGMHTRFKSSQPNLEAKYSNHTKL